ncbi:MAG: NAD(P)H-binding protein [Flavisolibacter sp.]
MQGKRAAVIGATGLIGSQILELLKDDPAFGEIRLLTRRPVIISHPKIEVRLVNFNDLENFKIAIDGCDVVFCAVGTTQKKVKGDRVEYRKVDYDIPVHAAQFCEETGCRHFLVVSSLGADAQSKNFYLRLKGEMEAAVSTKKVPAISIFRPSMLLGERNESRPLEKISQKIMSAFSFAIPSRYKAVSGAQVARVMVEVAKSATEGSRIFESEAIRNFNITADPRREQ